MKIPWRFLYFIALPICIGGVARTEMLSRPQASSAPLKFEVASIKPLTLVAGMILGSGCRGWDNPSLRSTGPFQIGLGRCRVVGGRFQGLIEDSFGAGHEHFSVSGLEKWMTYDGDVFVIEAKAEDGPQWTHEQLLEMMRTFIVEQFHLKFHYETKEVPGFNLVVSKGGPKWERLSDSEPQRPGFGGRGEQTGQTNPALLAQAISRHLGVPVSDRTGLSDRFEINLKWTPAPTDRDAVVGTEASEPGPSIFTALQEQLGLQLVPQKIPVQIFVIDHAEKPRFN